VAAKLGEPARSDVANALAGLYELARYTPDTGPLTAEEQAAARRHVAVLAPVAV
jgi:hypothetical protein